MADQIVMTEHDDEMGYVSVERSLRPHSPVVLGVGRGEHGDEHADALVWLSKDEARRIGTALIALAD